MDKIMIGAAFIVEGETEKRFYLSLLNYFCRKYNVQLEKGIVDPEPIYKISFDDKEILLKFNVVGTITQISNSGKWFISQCKNKYKLYDWNVYLCYDTDDYNADITKYYEGDWKVLRKELKGAKLILDIAAYADIEDVMLTDLEGICNYLGCSPNVTLKGRKGKVKMKNLFRDNQMTYHSGDRAQPLIDSLNMGLIVENCEVPLFRIEETLFN